MVWRNSTRPSNDSTKHFSQPLWSKKPDAKFVEMGNMCLCLGERKHGRISKNE
jgi:hypothetical protein